MFIPCQFCDLLPDIYTCFSDKIESQVTCVIWVPIYELISGHMIMDSIGILVEFVHDWRQVTIIKLTREEAYR